MDLVHGTRGTKASKFTKKDDQDDFSSMLPTDVMTNIMDRLPIRDAVRTGILSRTWRYKWTTMLSQVAFDEHFFKDLLGASQVATKNISYDDCRNVILKLLLHLVKGSVTKFILYLPRDMTFDVEDINNWFLFLSGKGISDVTVNNNYDNTQFMLPAHFFSCGQLMHLNLQNCGFDPPPSFRGFPNLLSLDLYRVQFDDYKFEELITHCPLLESLRILIYGCQVKQVDIAKLKNLKDLRMSLKDLDTRPLTSSGVIQLVASFPKLEELHLNFCITFLAEAGGNKMDDVLATFPCLKTLKLRFIDLASDIMASYVLKMIRSSPNLQTLNIWVDFFDDVPHHALSSSDLDCSTMGMLQLQSAVFVGSDCSENEVYLIKFLLACSPLLKKIVIGTHPSTKVDESHNFATKLLKLHRASPVAEIDFSCFSDNPLSFFEFSSNFG